MKKTVFAASMMMLTGLGAATPAMAYEAGDWLVRGRVINVNPNDDSGQLYLNTGSGYAAGGEGVEVNDDTVPELDITYMLSRNWGLELILGYSEHTVKGKKNWDALGDVIDSKVLPPTLTLQYHFLPDSNIRPYVGAGINYTYFFDEEVAGNVLDVPGAKVDLDSSWGLAFQAGVDVAVNQDWFVNFDVKYIDIDTEAHFSDIMTQNSGIKAKINADIDPIVWGIGIGRRF
jgi:outer membrane protein